MNNPDKVSAALSVNQTRSILIVGNYLSRTTGIRGVCEDLSDQLERKGWVIIRKSMIYNRFMRLMDMLIGCLKYRNRYNLAAVEVYSGKSFLWAAMVTSLLKLLKKPYIVTLHGGNLPSFFRRFQRISRWFLASADLVTTPSLYIKNFLKNMEDNILYLPNAIDIQQYKPDIRRRPRPRLVWMRAFHRIYNPMMAVRTVAMLAPDFPNIHLTMIGPDKGDGTLQKVIDLAKAEGVLTNLEIVHAVPKSAVASQLNQYDIFLNTTSAESFGISVIEAAALGLCIITTNVGEIPFLWSNGKNALLLDPDDHQAMAKAVRRVLQEEGLSERLSVSARKNAERFSWPLVLPQWESAFNGLMMEKEPKKNR